MLSKCGHFFHKLHSCATNMKFWQTMWELQPGPYVHTLGLLGMKDNVQIHQHSYHKLPTFMYVSTDRQND